MRAIASTDPALLDLVLDHVAEYAEEYEPDVLARRPLEVLAGAAEEREDVFLAYLAELPLQRLEALQLDEATLALVDEALKLNTQLTGWSHLPRFRFGEAEIDRARALGVLLEYGDEAPLVSDFAVYQDLCRTAVAAGVEGLRQRVREREEEREAEGASAPAGERAAQSDELSELERSHRRAMRELAATAHGANLDLGESLRSGLGIVDPADINVARFFVYGLLGPDTHNSYNLNNPVSAIALRGIRLVNPDFREDVTKTRQDGSKGALRIVYGDGRDHADHASWLWKYLAGANSSRGALRPRPGRHRRRALRLPTGSPGKPAAPSARLVLTQGKRDQGAGEAGRPARCHHAQGAGESDRESRDGVQRRPRTGLRRRAEGRSPGSRSALRSAGRPRRW